VALLNVTRTDDRHTAQRLSAEPVIWLGTVRPDGRPHNVPVWFAWHDPMVLIFSMPKTAKVRDVRLSPAVSLALDSADGGQDIVLAEGRAELIAGPDRHPHLCVLPNRPAPAIPDAIPCIQPQMASPPRQRP
jgi:PPOX class probable F420-dependent enzyme